MDNINKAEKEVLENFFKVLLVCKTKKGALKKILDELLLVNWLPKNSSGGVYLTSEEDKNQLNPYIITGVLEKESFSPCKILSFGECPCGKIAAIREIILTSCLTEEYETLNDKLKVHEYYNVPFFNSKGKLLGVIVLYLDVDHQKKEEEVNFLELISYGIGVLCERFDNEEKYLKQQMDLLKHKKSLDVTALVSETDLKGIITYANDKFCEISKYSRDELVGSSHNIVNSGFHSKQFWSKCWQTIKSGRVWKGEVCNRAKNGSLYWVESTIFPIFDNEGQITGYSSVRIDITSKKETEKQFLHQSKLASIGVLAAGIGHEINNPLAISMGNIHQIKRMLNLENIKNYKIFGGIKKLEIANERIRQIVDGLRTYSRTDSDQIEQISVNEALEQTLGLITEIYKNEGVKIKRDFCEYNFFILGLSGKLQQVIMNLISNAKDASEGQDYREIRISLNKGIDDCLVLCVSDNGSGIPDEIKNKLLDPFFTTKSVGKGTGMGLSITSELIKKMSGTLKIESHVGEGSSFYVILPYTDIQECHVYTNDIEEIKVVHPQDTPTNRSYESYN